MKPVYSNYDLLIEASSLNDGAIIETLNDVAVFVRSFGGDIKDVILEDDKQVKMSIGFKTNHKYLEPILTEHMALYGIGITQAKNSISVSDIQSLNGVSSETKNEDLIITEVYIPVMDRAGLRSKYKCLDIIRVLHDASYSASEIKSVATQFLVSYLKRNGENNKYHLSPVLATEVELDDLSHHPDFPLMIGDILSSTGNKDYELVSISQYQPSIRDAVLPIEIMSQDMKKHIMLDAEAWFDQADDENIVDLAESNWMDGSVFDEMLDWYSHRNRISVTSVLSYAAEHEQQVYVKVDREAVLTWLEDNRSILWNRLIANPNINPSFVQV